MSLIMNECNIVEMEMDWTDELEQSEQNITVLKVMSLYYFHRLGIYSWKKWCVFNVQFNWQLPQVLLEGSETKEFGDSVMLKSYFPSMWNHCQRFAFSL